MKDKLLNSPCIKRRYERIAEVQGIKAADAWLNMVTHTVSK